MNEHEFIIMEADSSHEAEIMELVASQYSGIVSSSEYWDWRYFKNRFGDVRIFCASDRSNRVIAMQAVTSFKASLGCRQSGKLHLLTAAVTHESFRRKGLFTRIIEHIQDELITSDSDIAFTIPNPISRKAFRQFERWELWRNLIWWVRFCPGPAWRVNRKMAAINIRPVSFSDNPLNAAIVREWYPDCWIIDRSESYFKGRFGVEAPFAYRLDAADINGKTAGYLITASKRLMGLDLTVIADIAAESQEVMEGLLSHASQIAIESGKTGVGLLGYPEFIRSGLLLRLGYVPVPSWVTRRRFSLFLCRVHNRLQAVKPAYRIAIGDTDLI